MLAVPSILSSAFCGQRKVGGPWPLLIAVDSFTFELFSLQTQSEIILNDLDVARLIHMVDNFGPDRMIEQRLAVLNVHSHPVDVCEGLLGILFSQEVFHELRYGALYGELHVSELLVYLVSQDFSEE